MDSRVRQNLWMAVAMDKNRLIGDGDAIPWKLRNDLRYFANLTRGRTVLMGRRTFDAILARLGGPLPGRENAVLTRSAADSVRAWGGVPLGTLAEALALSETRETVVVIGGAEIYALTLPYVSRMYLTEVDGLFSGDAFFPDWCTVMWNEIAAIHYFADEHNSHNFCIRILLRKNNDTHPGHQHH